MGNNIGVDFLYRVVLTQFGAENEREGKEVSKNVSAL